MSRVRNYRKDFQGCLPMKTDGSVIQNLCRSLGPLSRQSFLITLPYLRERWLPRFLHYLPEWCNKVTMIADPFKCVKPSTTISGSNTLWTSVWHINYIYNIDSPWTQRYFWQRGFWLSGEVVLPLLQLQLMACRQLRRYLTLLRKHFV